MTGAARRARRRLLQAGLGVGLGAALAGPARGASGREPLPETARAPSETAPGDKAMQALSAEFAAWQKEPRPALVAGIVCGDEPALLHACGFASLEHQASASIRTRFEIASVSKHITACLIYDLLRAKQLGLDDHVRDYLPWLSPMLPALRIRHLIHHTNGLKDCLWFSELAGRLDDGDHIGQDAIRRLTARQDELHFPPGADYRYNNTGYFLLAELIETVSGQPLRHFAAQRLFAPLGMSDTLIADNRNEAIPALALAYRRTRTGDSNHDRANGAWRHDPVRFEAAGPTGVVTTGPDLLRWIRHLLSPQSRASGLLSFLAAPGRLDDGRPIEYGAGMFLRRVHGSDAIVHAGSLGGYRSWLAILPDARRAAFVLSAGPFDGFPVLERLLQPAQPPAVKRPASEAPATVKNELLKALPGEYLPDNWKLLWITRHGDALEWHEAGERPKPLLIDSDGSVRQSADSLYRLTPQWQGGAITALVETRDASPFVAPVTYQRAKAATPDKGELKALQGRYYCDMLEAVHTLHLTEQGLVLQAGWAGHAVKLFPTVADRFEGDRFGWMVQVERGPGGLVDSLLVGSPRARGFRFVRLDAT